jgi:hypothetical protein
MSASTPKKQAMPITITQRGLLIGWKCVVALSATGRLETCDESNAEGMGFPPGIVIACDMALILLMRG